MIVGTLGETVGWHWGFAAAGIGMLIGLSIYAAGQKYLPSDAPVRRSARSTGPRPALSRRERLITAALILLIPVLAVAIIPNNQIFPYPNSGCSTPDLLSAPVRCSCSSSFSSGPAS